MIVIDEVNAQWGQGRTAAIRGALSTIYGDPMTLMISTHRLPEPTMAIAIEPQGEIRSEDAHKLSDRVIAVLAATRPQRIVVDLSLVPSISDAGIVALRSGHDEAAAQDANLVVVDPEPQVREQLRCGGLDDLLDGSGNGSRS